LEVAIKYDDEPTAYPFGNENYERWRAFRDPSLALPSLKLPRITRIAINLVGSGVVMKRRQFFLRVTNAGMQIEPC
jgi:hypothetical protein